MNISCSYDMSYVITLDMTWHMGSQNYELIISSPSEWLISAHTYAHKTLRFDIFLSLCFSRVDCRILFLSIDPLVQTTDLAGSDHYFRTDFRPYVRPNFSKYRITKQTSPENNDHYWWDCVSGRGDHWWHMSCLSFFHAIFRTCEPSHDTNGFFLAAAYF